MTKTNSWICDICKKEFRDSNDDLKRYFRQWAKKNNYPMPKMIRIISHNFAYNDAGDIIAVVQECDKNLYYNDSCNRYCYIKKSKEGIDFKYI